MLKLIHLDRAMRYAAWMERANDPHVLRSPKPAPVVAEPVASNEPSTGLPPKKTRAKKLPRAK